MERIKLQRTNQRPLSFVGELLATDDYPMGTGRWVEASLYQTKAGRLIMHVVWATAWQGEEDYLETHSFSTPAELADWMEEELPRALPLLEEAGFEVVEEVE